MLADEFLVYGSFSILPPRNPYGGHVRRHLGAIAAEVRKRGREQLQRLVGTS